MIEWREVTVPVAKLKPFERNPRRISKEAYERLKASIRDLGYHQRIIATDDYRVIGGHQRIKALNDLGINKIKILVPSRELADNEFRQLMIQDNLPFGEFNYDILSQDFEYDELVEWGMPEEWLVGKYKTDFDDERADELPEDVEPRCKLGDLWALGDHRLVCGDATSAVDVSNLLSGVKPHLMVTDPPYGVEYDPDWRNRADRAKGKPYGDRAVGRVTNDDRSDWSPAYVNFPGDVAYVWAPSGPPQFVFYQTLISSGFEVRTQIIWAKQQFPIGRGHYHIQHEPCLYAVRRGKHAHWVGDRKQTTLWHINKPVNSETGHSTQKPIECMRRPMLNNSSEGQAVYDPFLGSGTSIIAAEQTGRHCYGLEIHPPYADICLSRWEQFTGKTAELLDRRISVAAE